MDRFRGFEGMNAHPVLELMARRVAEIEKSLAAKTCQFR